MGAFTYRDGTLHVEQVPVPEIASVSGTPAYIYSATRIEENLRSYLRAFEAMKCLVCYGMKANSNQAVLRLLVKLGAGFDAVSGGEIARAIAAGARPDRIVFSGVGKSRSEIKYALNLGVRHFNVESEGELLLLDEIGRSTGTVAPVGIRINPNVDAKTHRHISTGMAENKFGIPIERARAACQLASDLNYIKLHGIDMHIGSQLTSLDPYEIAFRKLSSLVTDLRADGHDIRHVDIGGGLGVTYKQDDPPPPKPDALASLVQRTLGHLDCEIELEPGRSIVADAGILVATVLYNKIGEGRQFLVLDAAMNDLMRPALYTAYHELIPVIEADPGAKLSPVDIVGPVCETTDTFARQRQLPNIYQDQLVALMTAGGYCAVMASEYNCRPLVPEVLVSRDKWSIIRERPKIESIIDRDIIPPWIM